MTHIKIYSLILFWLFAWCYEIEAYPVETHEIITKELTKNNTVLDSRIKIYTGALKGIDENLDGKRIVDWMKKGSYDEDLNWGWTWRDNSLYSHFYDPLTNTSGVGDIWPSAYDWANNSNNENQWSWRKARYYLYSGLTMKADINHTNQYRYVLLAKAFRALGHVVHLVQDMAVPAHTRADLHGEIKNIEVPLIGKDMYETYIKKNIARYLGSSISFSSGYVSTSSGAPRHFWDTDTYTGSSIPTTNVIGLAEYTNANFFSVDTIFSTRYPHPSYADTTYPSIDWRNPEITDAEDGKFDNRIYIRKTVGEADARIAAMSYLSYDCIQKGHVEYSPWILDEVVHNDYASLLIPRAVGYSAGLLNYFFRGTLEISAPDTHVYAITDGSITPQQFSHIKSKVKNTTPNEVMSDGILQAVARYKIVPNYDPNLANYPPDGTVMNNISYSYSVSDPLILSSEQLGSLNMYPTEFTFDFTNSPIPAGITDLTLQVIFKGTLGSELDNAIAVGMKNLMEPTHHVFWNLTDMFSLYIEADNAYRLYTAEQIRANPALSALTAGAYIDPHNITYEFTYMAESPPAVPAVPIATIVLPAGRHIRLIVLTDKKENNYAGIASTSVPYPNEKYSEVPFQGAQYEEVDGLWHSSPATPFRAVNGHFSRGVIACKPYVDGCPYPESEAIPALTTPYPAVIDFP